MPTTSPVYILKDILYCVLNTSLQPLNTVNVAVDTQSSEYDVSSF